MRALRFGSHRSLISPQSTTAKPGSELRLNVKSLRAGATLRRHAVNVRAIASHWFGLRPLLPTIATSGATVATTPVVCPKTAVWLVPLSIVCFFIRREADSIEDKSPRQVSRLSANLSRPEMQTPAPACVQIGLRLPRISRHGGLVSCVADAT